MGYYTDIKEAKHKIKVKLYPNYLPANRGKYIARTNNENTLTIDEVCAALAARTGYKGDYKKMAEYVKKYYDEVAYQLSDGFAVNNGYYSIHPHIGGTLNSSRESHNRKKNPICFRFRTKKMLKELIENISVEIGDIDSKNGFIDEFLDYDMNSVNSLFIPGNQFCISGLNIRIYGDNPACGLYFVPIDDPTSAIKAERIMENKPSKITGIIPAIKYSLNRIVIRTQFAGPGIPKLKTSRVITSRFTIEAAF